MSDGQTAPGGIDLSSEGGIGWLPYLVQRAGETYRKHRHWTRPRISQPPGVYFRRHNAVRFSGLDASV